MAIETTLAVPDLRTVDPGPRRLTARYATADGTPISGAAVTATGSTSSLPLAMAEEEPGTYGAVVDIPPDVDGTCSIIRVAAHQTGYATAHAATSFFSADPAEPTHAVTVADPQAPEEGRVNVLFTQSHGNEPGATAALMDVINQLATGVTQEGHRTPLPRERLLRSLRVVCIPIGNPSGRARAPVQRIHVRSIQSVLTFLLERTSIRSP